MRGEGGTGERTAEAERAASDAGTMCFAEETRRQADERLRAKEEARARAEAAAATAAAQAAKERPPSGVGSVSAQPKPKRRSILRLPNRS